LLGKNASGADAGGGKPDFSFGVVTDIQYCDCDPAGTRYYANSLVKEEACVKDFNGMDLTHVLQLGDFIDHDFVSLEKVSAIYEKLKFPRYHALGNHDFDVAEDKKPLVMKKLGLKRGYYDFAQGAWRFIVLDGNDLSARTTAEGSAKRKEADAMRQKLVDANAPNAHEWNGGISAEQLAWLDGTLDDAAKKKQQALVFCHFPVYPANQHNLWNDWAIIDLLESHECVFAYINGHNHAGNYGEKNGIHYVTVHGMVETPDTTAYAKISVYPDRLEIDGVDREPDRTLV